jgi:antitoxin component YwqK of YwqJK toxin-antitoxin module
MFFPKTIYTNVMENMKKSYGEDWRELKSKRVAQFFYLQSKKLGRVGNMVEDIEQGKWTYYYDTGELKSKKEFSNGIILSETCWDKQGNEVSCSKWDKYGNEI